jgi:hypothetical protein
MNHAVDDVARNSVKAESTFVSSSPSRRVSNFALLYFGVSVESKCSFWETFYFFVELSSFAGPHEGRVWSTWLVIRRLSRP